jgi:hypothetical protein
MRAPAATCQAQAAAGVFACGAEFEIRRRVSLHKRQGMEKKMK